MTKFSLKREIDFGDLLTPFSILVSVFAVVLTWINDTDLRTKQYADSIRRSSSVLAAKLDRWAVLEDRYFEDLQPALILASLDTSKTHNVQPAKRDLYRGLKDAESKASQRIIDEQLEISYMELYGYIPSLEPPFEKIRQGIKKAETDSHRRLEAALQCKILGPDSPGCPEDPEYLTNMRDRDSGRMGNALRGEAEVERKRLRVQIDEITSPLRTNMLRLIQLEDKKLLDKAAVSALFDQHK